MNERTVFLNALEHADPAARAAYLDAACAGAPAFRQRIETLLCSHAHAGTAFLAIPIVERGTDTSTGTTENGNIGSSGAACPSDGAGPRTETPWSHDDPFARPARAPEHRALGRLDNYEILEPVGCGGMGAVLKARDTKLQRVVAIKVLAPGLAASDTARARFLREAQAAAAVRDDHVVDIYAVHDDPPYLVMEYIDGMTLDQRIRRGPLALDEVLRIGMQTARGLAAAHAQGLVHRDIKPANILLENGIQRVKITDFGLSRAVSDAGLTQVGVVAGTPMYMSPEQARGEAVDHRSDLFSLGTVLYVLCAGRTPWAAENALAVMRRVNEDTPRPIRELNADVPDWLCALVARLHAKDPARRFQTAHEVAEVLARGLVQLQQPGAAEPDPRHEPAPPPRAKGSRRARALRWLVGATVLFALSVTVCTIRNPGPPVPVPETGPEPEPVPDMDKSPWIVSGTNGDPKRLFADPAHALADVRAYSDIAGATSDEFRKWNEGLDPTFRVAAISCRHGIGTVRFNAVAVRQKERPNIPFFHDDDGENGYKTCDELDNNGFRPLASVHHFGPANDDRERLSHLWVKDDRRFFTWCNTNPEVVRAEIAKNKLDDFRLIFLEAVQSPFGLRTQAVLAHDPGRVWEVEYALDPEELLARVQRYPRRGWRPDVIAPYWNNDQLRFALVGVENSDHIDWRFQMDMSATQYRETSARQKDLGLFPLALVSYGHADEIRYAAIFVRYRAPGTD